MTTIDADANQLVKHSPLAWGARGLLAMVLLLATASKLSDPAVLTTAFAALGWGWLVSNALAVTSGAAGVEFFLAACLLVLPGNRWTLAATMALLLTFTAFLFALSRVPDAPSCGCLGILTDGQSGDAPVWPAIVRNVGMLLVAGWLWGLTMRWPHV